MCTPKHASSVRILLSPQVTHGRRYPLFGSPRAHLFCIGLPASHEEGGTPAGRIGGHVVVVVLVVVVVAAAVVVMPVMAVIDSGGSWMLVVAAIACL